MTESTRLSTSFGPGHLFQVLRDGRPRTRSELATETGLSRSTISARVDALLATGLIAPVSDAVSTGGRPSARVGINAGARLVAAADLGATHATVALTDLSGDVQLEKTSRRSITAGPTACLDWLAQTILELVHELGREPADVIAVGIGLPGPVEHATGRPTSPPIMPGWDGYDVPGHVRRTFQVPVLVDNDANVMALGERSKGWPDVDDVLVVKVATGIGAGIILGGVLQRGADGSAGDIGHITIPSAAGVLCRCGSVGCLEAVAGAPAILRRLAEQGTVLESAEELALRVNSGDLTVMQALREAGRSIGEVVTTCINVVNPSLIVVTGFMAQFSDLLIAGIRQTVYARAMPLATRNLTIAPSRVGAQAGVIGAGILALSHVLSPDHLDASTDLTRSS